MPLPLLQVVSSRLNEIANEIGELQGSAISFATHGKQVQDLILEIYGSTSACSECDFYANLDKLKQFISHQTSFKSMLVNYQLVPEMRAKLEAGGTLSAFGRVYRVEDIDDQLAIDNLKCGVRWFEQVPVDAEKVLLNEAAVVAIPDGVPPVDLTVVTEDEQVPVDAEKVIDLLANEPVKAMGKTKEAKPKE
jgi:hypothetical protein